MSKYGKCAVQAVNLFRTRKSITLKEAWNLAAIAEFGQGSSSHKKGCPRNAFLGLCEDGVVIGIPSGNYTSSIKNKSYALGAVRLLKKNPKLVANSCALWNQVTFPRNIVHNQQMDVVIWLHQNGLLIP